MELPDFKHTVTEIRAKIDTGAQGSILPLRLYKQMFPTRLTPEGEPISGSLKHTDVILTAQLRIMSGS